MNTKAFAHFLKSLARLRAMAQSTDPKVKLALTLNAIASGIALLLALGFFIWLTRQWAVEDAKYEREYQRNMQELKRIEERQVTSP